MILVLVFGMVVVALFSTVIVFGAPYLPTLKDQQKAAFELLDLRPGQVLLELGSGDGRMLAEAARQGIRAVGYELNPLLAAWSWLMTRRYKGLVTVRCRNFWQADLAGADGIYVFLQDRFMARLHTKITQEIRSSVKLVSFAFQLPEVKHVTEKSGMYLYIFNNKNKV